MKSASTDFADAISESHTAVTTVDAWYAGRVSLADLPVTEGSVTLDADSLVRGSISLTVASDQYGIAPITPDSPLATYGQEVNPRRGVMLASGVAETVSLGWYRINTADTTIRWARHGDDLTVSGVAVALDGEDRMATARDFRFTSPYSTSGSVLACIRALVTACGLPVGDWSTVTDRTAPTATYEKERLDALAALASSVNAQVYLDGDGRVRVTPLPSLDSPQFIYSLGQDSDLLAVSLRTTRENVFNAVVAKSEDQAAGRSPLLSIATETSGPAQWGGPFGFVPYFYSSPLLATQAQTDSAARTRLANLISGRDIEMAISVLPDPRMEPNDAVRLVLPFATYTGRVKSVKVPLGAGGGAQEVTLRLMSDRTVLNWTALS